MVSRISGILPEREVEEDEDEESMLGDLMEGIWEDRGIDGRVCETVGR